MTTMTEYDYDDFPGRPKDPDGLDPKKTQEIWEITTPSTVWLWVTDAREGGYRKQRFGAGGNRRVRISIDDRRYNEEQVVDRTPELNPFTNGLLRLISRAVVEDIDTTAHLTDADLVGLLEMRERAIFEEAVQDIAFELPLRRLKALAEDRGTLSQNEFLSDLLIQRFPLPAAGTQPTVQEMIDEEEKATGTRLSG